MSLDEELIVNFDHSKDIDKEEVEQAFEKFLSIYELKVLGQKKIDILAENHKMYLFLKISPQAGSEIGGVVLREGFERNPEIFYTGSVGRKVNFCSERNIYLVELKSK